MTSKTFILTAIISSIFLSCKKESAESNITLYNKPLAVIQTYIKGKWNLAYEQGGICSICVHNFSDFTWTFSNDNRIKQIYKDSTIADQAIQWQREQGSFLNGEFTYLMKFSDVRQVPWEYVVDGIVNDTLILHDNSSDPVYYHFSKLNQ